MLGLQAARAGEQTMTPSTRMRSAARAKRWREVERVKARAVVAVAKTERMCHEARKRIR